MCGLKRGPKLGKPLKNEKKQEMGNWETKTWQASIPLIWKSTKTFLKKCDEKVRWAHGRSYAMQEEGEEFIQLTDNKSETRSIQQGSKSKLRLHDACSWIHEATCGTISTEKSRRPYRRQRGLFDDPLQFGSQVYSYASSDENPGCKSSSGQGMEEARDNSSVAVWQSPEQEAKWLESVKSKKEVILEAQRDIKKVHFATLMDICYLENAELEPTFQKYKGRVVCRGDTVKDDSGAYAVFTAQGSSASQIDCRKSNGCHIKTTRLWWTSSWCSICFTLR